MIQSHREIETSRPPPPPPVPNEVSDTIRNIVHQANEGFAYDMILDSVFTSLREVIPFDRLGVALLDESDSSLRTSWVKSLMPVKNLTRNFQAPLKGSSLERIITERTPRIIDDLEAYLERNPHSGLTKLALADGIRSSLTLPLVSGSKAIGIVFFSSAMPRTYQDSHVRLFSEISEAIAIVLEHGRLRRFFDENRTKDRLLAMILHDLRSPLGVVLSFLEIAMEEDWYHRLDKPAIDILTAIRRSSFAMKDLVSDLSEAVQLESGRLAVVPVEVDLQLFLEEFIQDARVLAGRKGIAFEADLAEDLPLRVQFDPQRVNQVLANLLTNAVKFSHSGTKILFRVSLVERTLRFSVTDQGQGIAPEEIPKLFGWLGKTSTRPTQNEGSTGLGLWISKQIVRAHGGDIGAESRLRQGSTFHFNLPLTGDH